MNKLNIETQKPVNNSSPREYSKADRLCTVRFIAGLINKNIILNKIWRAQNFFYQKIFSINYRDTFPYADDYAPILTPSLGFPANQAVLSLNSGKIYLETDFPARIIRANMRKEKYITAAGIMLFSDPCVKMDFPELYGPLLFNFKKSNYSKHITLEAHFSRRLYDHVLNFRMRNIWLVLVTLDKNYEPVNYSRLLTTTRLERIV